MMTVQNQAGSALDPQRLVGQLVAERPVRARLFERLHIDYCCGGQETLADACAKAGVPVEVVEAALLAVDEADAGSLATEVTDWRAADTAELCEHIVGVHHEFLRRSFPKLESLIGTVVRVHGSQEPALQELPRVFETIRAALEPHLASEETELFPAILAAAQGGPPVPEEILAGHEYEHAEVGAALVELRALCDDYDRRHARCNTHRAMLDALEELELDIHEHVHEENNILFPRAKHEELRPACCQGWADEQGERWARARRDQHS